MRRFARTLIAAALAAAAVHATADEAFDTGARNLLAVLRGSPEAVQANETLKPYGRVTVELPDGREVDVETSWYRFVGDMHIRLVFDSATQLQSASPDDLTRLHLDAGGALQLAVANLRQTYGEPQAHALRGGLMQVVGRADDLNSSYFLDREFWRARESEHPAGLVAAVPQRGGLLFAPADDEEAVAALRFSTAALYAAGRRSRVSSALYLFKEGRWSLYQPPALD